MHPGYPASPVGAAFIQKLAGSKKKTKKIPRVFFPKLVFRDLKRLPPPLPILPIPFSSEINPLGNKCLTCLFLRHASDSGFTVALGQHYHVPLQSQNWEFGNACGENCATATKIKNQRWQNFCLHHYRPGDKRQLKAQDVTAKLVRFDILRMVPKNILFCIKLT